MSKFITKEKNMEKRWKILREEKGETFAVMSEL